MTEIFILSHSINTLDKRVATTSSFKFELDFASALSKYIKTTIITLALPMSNSITIGDLRLLGVSNGGKISEKIIVAEIKKNRNSALIYYGYDFITEIHLLRIKRETGVFVFPFVFDSHTICVNEYKSRVKRIAANLYFQWGISKLRKFDGAILFQEKAAKILHLSKSYIVLKPGVSNGVDIEKKDVFDKFKVVFAGSFTALNGIDVLLKAFSKICNPNIDLYLYGYGPLIGVVKNYESSYSNIHYGGIVNDEKLTDIYRQAQVLINLRNLDDYANNFAFPSKLFEYINTNTPVITTKLLEDKEFCDTVYILHEIQVKDIINAIYDIKNNYEIYLQRAKRAKEYIANNYGFDRIAMKTIDYIKEISK